MHGLDKVINYKINTWGIQAILHEEIIGALNMVIIEDGTINLNGLWVKNAWKHKGIATKMNKLLIESVTVTKEHGIIIAKTSNPNVRKILERMDFKRIACLSADLFIKEF